MEELDEMDLVQEPDVCAYCHHEIRGDEIAYILKGEPACVTCYKIGSLQPPASIQPGRLPDETGSSSGVGALLVIILCIGFGGWEYHERQRAEAAESDLRQELKKTNADLDALRATVNYNADVANRNNRRY